LRPKSVDAQEERLVANALLDKVPQALKSMYYAENECAARFSKAW
jgi:hypothetical protein